MARLPRGVVTMLFTDIEGSTRLLQKLGRDRYVEALRAHRALLRDAAETHGGVEVEMQGDSFHFAFRSAGSAVAAAAAMQRALSGHDWPDEPVRVRIGVHTGEPMIDGELYAGLDVHRAARVMSAGHGGQTVVSATTWEATREALPEGLSFRDLGLHRLKDLLEPQRLYELAGPGLPSGLPPLNALGAHVGLPVPANRLIGREQELAAIAELLDGRTQLLTLVGPGGTGKTRLAVQAAAELSDRFPDGVWFVALAPVRDESLVAGAIARAVGHREQPGEDLVEALGAELRGKRALLLVDNVEHVVGAAPELGRLLELARGVTALATSREPLHLRAERVLAVPPLPAETDAAIMFAERARAVSGEFSLTDENVAAVAAICRRLDGLPLAVELAAARTATLSPQALLARLDASLGLLTGGPRDADERQRTLRGTIDWSYDLLSPAEQELFVGLFPFAGGARLDAVDHVAGADALPLLASLADKSLLRRSDDPDGEPRFRLLETVREYAQERAAAAGSTEAWRSRHADWFLALAGRAEPELTGPRSAEWLDRLEPDFDNLRVALRFLIETRDGEAALRLAAFASRVWLVRGSLVEARRMLEDALEIEGDFPSRARALRRVAIHSMDAGDLERAAAAASEAVSLDEASGDTVGAAQSAGIAADVAAHSGDMETAGRLYAEAAEQLRLLGDERELAVTLYNLANVRLVLGAEKEAAAYFAEALAGFERVGDRLGQGGTLLSMVQLAVGKEDWSRAGELLRRAAGHLDAIGYVGGLANVLETSARIASATEQYEPAARLYGAFHAQTEAIGRAGVHPAELAQHDQSIGATRTALGTERFEAAWTEGAALELAAAVALAVETVAGTAQAHSSAATPT